MFAAFSVDMKLAYINSLLRLLCVCVTLQGDRQTSIDHQQQKLQRQKECSTYETFIIDVRPSNPEVIHDQV